MELGSVGFGFDILEGNVPPTVVKTSENIEIKETESRPVVTENKNEKDLEDFSQEVIEWAIKDVDGGNFTDKHLDAILESFEGKGNITDDFEKHKDTEVRQKTSLRRKPRKGTKSCS